MAKRKKNKRAARTAGEINHDALRRAAGQAKVADLRDGRVRRAQTFVDRRREANRRACRGRVQY